MEKTSHCLPSINSHFFLSNGRTTLCPARRPPTPAWDTASWHSWTGAPGRLTRGCLTLLLFQPETWVGEKNGSILAWSHFLDLDEGCPQDREHGGWGRGHWEGTGEAKAGDPQYQPRHRVLSRAGRTSTPVGRLSSCLGPCRTQWVLFCFPHHTPTK